MKTKLTQLFIEFLGSQQASGVILILSIMTSIVISNSPLGKSFLDFWQNEVGFGIGTISLSYSLQHWVNDGLIAIFFLLIGLEIEREIFIGELSDLKNASLPIFAAIGGMLTPALFHFVLNMGTETQGGAGIPIATDIAFAIAALALLGSKVPASLKIFLVALAIIDDLGAIAVIALVYARDLSLLNLILALGVFVGLLLLNRLGVNRLPFYLIPGVIMWYFMLKSGIHPSIAGVLMAFAIPFGRGDEESPSYRLQHFLHKPVAFIIIPLFALANSGISLTGNWIGNLATANSLGIFAGLYFGKPLGIALFSLVAVKLGLSQLPNNVLWKHIVGVGFLGGIGYTMSIFITILAFGSSEVIQSSKIAILFSSLLAGITGFLILNKRTTPSNETL